MQPDKRDCLLMSAIVYYVDKHHRICCMTTNFDCIFSVSSTAYDSASVIGNLIKDLKSGEPSKLLDTIRSLERVYQQKYVSVERVLETF